MTKTTILVGALVVSASLFAAKPERDWKTGTVLDTANTRENIAGSPVVIAQSSSGSSSDPSIGAAGNSANAAMAAAAASPRSRDWVGFTIEDADYRFTVTCAVLRRRPNVTVHGPVKYALEKGTFYLKDDDDREFKMIVLEKALRHPVPPPVK